MVSVENLGRKLRVASSVAVVAIGIGVGFDAQAAWAMKPPHCASGCPVPSGLKWKSANSIFDGVPAQFGAISHCPDTRPDGSPVQGTREIFVTIFFTGGAMTQGPIPVDRNGRWTGTLSFNAGGLTIPSATAEAECDDVTSVTGVPLAFYGPHPVSVNS